jgi:SsrA-binding protein
LLLAAPPEGEKIAICALRCTERDMDVETPEEGTPMSVDVEMRHPYYSSMVERKNESKRAPDVTLALNKRAYHDYLVVQTFEAGISLEGTEVKSAKTGKLNFQDGFCTVRNGEIFLRNVNISQYPFGNRINHEPMRERKLLLHKGEILKLAAKVREKGLTIVPLKAYTKKGKIKVEIGLVKGKRQYDKKEDIRKKDEARDMKRNYKASNLSGKLK